MDVWIQILLISLGLSIFSQFLNKIMKMDPKHMKETQTRMRELSQELDAARGGSPGEFNVHVGKSARSYEEINAELMALMKKMSKEQLIPCGIRCGIFWGIFALIGFFYSEHYSTGVLSFEIPLFGSGWYGAYFLFSIIFSFSFLGLQKLYQKLTHQEKPAMSEIPYSAIPARISWKDRLEAVKKDSQGEDKPENQSSP